MGVMTNPRRVPVTEGLLSLLLFVATTATLPVASEEVVRQSFTPIPSGKCHPVQSGQVKPSPRVSDMESILPSIASGMGRSGCF